MKSVLVTAVFILLLLPVASATSLKADFSISANDIVTEAVSVVFEADEAYDSFVFTAISEPFSVIYDGSYSVREQNGSYKISFAKDIKPGENTVSFQLLYDNMIEKSGSGKSFRTALSSAVVDEIKVSATLPAGFMLSEHAPQATPEPQSITTDGRRITLHWSFENTGNAAVAVFYTSGQSFSAWWLLLIPVALALGFLAFFIFHKKRVRSIVSDTLSEDEQKVIDLVRQGNDKQNEIAKALDFSKSKMSKVVRKLEEKGLVEKSPFFKTNVIKLKKI
ncbi:MAG: helix-turn-helix domain-containing protein [Candidatus Woesearchaeota archaeon]